MERIPLGRLSCTLGCALWVAFGGGTSLWAQEQEATELAKSARPVDEQQAAAKPKYRNGSWLLSSRALPTSVDLRSELEKIRDREVWLHIERCAELDVMAARSRKLDSGKLLDRVEALRRLVYKRHRRVLKSIVNRGLSGELRTNTLLLASKPAATEHGNVYRDGFERFAKEITAENVEDRIDAFEGALVGPETKINRIGG